MAASFDARAFAAASSVLCFGLPGTGAAATERTEGRRESARVRRRVVDRMVEVWKWCDRAVAKRTFE